MSVAATYDPKKVTVAVDGRVITGWAADGVIKLTRSEDTVTPITSVKGETTYDENANISGNAELSLMSTSSSLAYLRDLCDRRKMVRLTISDVNEDDPVQVNEEDCRILKVADVSRVKNSGTITVNIFVPELNFR